jgi:hypothetical protein
VYEEEEADGVGEGERKGAVSRSGDGFSWIPEDDLEPAMGWRHFHGSASRAAACRERARIAQW